LQLPICFQGLLVGRDESICPKLLLLSARVSCIIDKKDGKHLDRAVNMLWQLYDVIAISIEFEGFGLLLLDLLTVVSLSNINIFYVYIIISFLAVSF
jgi:hypothetical protein